MAGPRKAKQLAQPMYVVARGGHGEKRIGRPLCQHKLDMTGGALTACGLVMEQWSVTYTKEPLDAILCRRAACRMGA